MHFLTDSVSLPYALAYQIDNSGNPVALGWIATYTTGVQAGVVGFNFSTYDTAKPLMLQFGGLPAGGGGGTEPSLAWSTLIGTDHAGGASEFISAGDADSEGNLYVAGSTRDGAFPVNTGSEQHQGNTDIVYGKIKYLPGDLLEDAAVAYMVFFGDAGDEKPIVLHTSVDDGEEVLYVGGWTNSTLFPVVPVNNPNDGTYYQATRKGVNDGFFLKASCASSVVARSTYFGGEGTEMITAVTEDSEGNIYFGGATTSETGAYAGNCASPSTGFPMCSTEAADLQQTANGGGTDAFILRLDPAFNLTWSTFYGGIGDDHVYDAAYMPAPATPSGPNDRIAFVGSSTKAVPFGAGGTYQITTNNEENGFITTFDSDCRPKWGTFIRGLYRLEAVVADKNNLLVMGVTKNDATATLSCDEVLDGIPVCDPGAGAFQDAIIAHRDLFFAEFVQPSGTLLWSSAYGDLGWLGADFPDENMGSDFFMAEQTQPFPIYRFSDLEADPTHNIYAMGLFDYRKWNQGFTQSTVPASGLYNQAWEPETGSHQTDVNLFLFDSDRRLQWASMYGGGFNHVTPPFDLQWHAKGCDFGHDLALVPDKALYCVGTAGGVALPEACPSPLPGNGLCEASLVAVGDNFDAMQGFATRMAIVDGTSVGTQDEIQMELDAVSVFPNPTTGFISFRASNGSLAKATVHITNALGQTVFLGLLDEQGSMDVTKLASGSFAAHLITAREGTAFTVRFNIQ